MPLGGGRHYFCFQSTNQLIIHSHCAIQETKINADATVLSFFFFTVFNVTKVIPIDTVIVQFCSNIFLLQTLLYNVEA